jgi:hypothetical protein
MADFGTIMFYVWTVSAAIAMIVNINTTFELPIDLMLVWYYVVTLVMCLIMGPIAVGILIWYYVRLKLINKQPKINT